ncbi:MAG: Crp/Fnr family transcriptional regulator [Bacteroidia bacterium]
MPFLEHLSSLLSVSDVLASELKNNCTKVSIPKGKLIVEIGHRCTDLYFIEKGLMRGYYFDDGKEITNWFAQENEFATCLYAFIALKPSFENIQTLEDCELIQIPYAVLQQLYTTFPETERLGRIITENYYLKLEERLLNLQFKSAKERYQSLSKSKPSLLRRASLGQIASYLGITQETLSRIRAEV